jgi:hypothetical protein
MNAKQLKYERRRWYVYDGPLGEIVHRGRYFFAWKEGRRIGIYGILEEALESLEESERLKMQ